MSKLLDLKNAISEEFRIIFNKSFSIDITKASSVPHSNDSAITFPNLETYSQRCKVIETAVLYVDIRRSTELNLQHRPETVARLYSAFVRSMTYCANYNRGHVRGIIGDRIMVLFNPSTAFIDAVDTAITMNSTIQYLLDKYFKRNEIKCGIGIDYGRMLITKTGTRRNGIERSNYQSLVWLGRPANIASKLTDLANKKTTEKRLVINEAYTSLLSSNWRWNEAEIEDFISNLSMDYSVDYPPFRLRHSNPFFRTFFTSNRESSNLTPPILMTKVVYDGYKKERPSCPTVVKPIFVSKKVDVPGYTGLVYGGDAVYMSTFK